MVLCQKVGHANADLQPSKPLEHYKDGEPYTPKGVSTVRGGGPAMPSGLTVPTLHRDGKDSGEEAGETRTETSKALQAVSLGIGVGVWESHIQGEGPEE